MHLTQLLRDSGGILHVRRLRAAGFTSHRIATALSSGAVIRPQRGWIALPGSDPELLQAASAGTILSCVSVTRRLGLWLLDQSEPHFAARSPHAHPQTTAKVHWRAPVRRREPQTLLDPLENALNYIAYCQPPEEAIAIWESALNKRLVTLAALRRYPYVGRAKEILQTVTPFSDSGLESYVGTRLRALGLRFVVQAYLHEHRRDFLIEGWLILEIDGATHTGRQRDLDNAQDWELSINGLGRIRAGYRQVLECWPDVQDAIMRLLSQGRPSSREEIVFQTGLGRGKNPREG